MNGWAAATNPQKMRVEPLLLMKMKYDGVFYRSFFDVGKSVQCCFFDENARKTKINAMWLAHNLLLDWVRCRRKIFKKVHWSKEIMNCNELVEVDADCNDSIMMQFTIWRMISKECSFINISALFIWAFSMFFWMNKVQLCSKYSLIQTYNFAVILGNSFRFPAIDCCCWAVSMKLSFLGLK